MQRFMFTYGAISGVVTIVSMILSLELFAGEQSMGALEWIGYLIMLVALSMIFVAVKRYRDLELGGVIPFGKALALGVSTAVVASLAYVVIWEAYIAISGNSFIDAYTDGVIAARRAEGASPAELDAVVASMREMKENYADPLFRIPMTFVEIFPMGLIIALVSAGVLRNPRVLPAE